MLGFYYCYRFFTWNLRRNLIIWGYFIEWWTEMGRVCEGEVLFEGIGRNFLLSGRESV